MYLIMNERLSVFLPDAAAHSRSEEIISAVLPCIETQTIPFEVVLSLKDLTARANLRSQRIW